MNLQARDAKNDLNAGVGQTLRPRNIGLLIKTGGQFYHYSHTFPVVLRVD